METELVDEYYEAEAAQAASFAEFLQNQQERYTGVIHYGFGAEYLPKWGIKEALREIYQNFIDYGDYTEESVVTGDMACVKLTNGWKPASLEYLRIGNSRKDNPNAIGHHGEGLKMAFLILLREGFTSMIFTNRYAVYPEWYHDNEIGECFCFNYEVHDFYESPYTLEFECKLSDWQAFKENLITPADIVYSHYEYGELLSKEPGNIYSGGLFVAKLEGIGRSYNIKPYYMPLDRDRCVPQAFNVEYYSAKILEASEVLNVKDLGYSDTRYITKLPERMYSQVKAHKVGNDIQFTIKDDKGKQQIIANDGLKEHLKGHSLFQKAIARLKKMLAKQIGIYDLLVAFQQKHIHTAEAKQDFQVILDRIEK